MKIIKFRNCPCLYFSNIGFGMIVMFEDGILNKSQDEFFLMRFSSKSYFYEDMKI